MARLSTASNSKVARMCAAQVALQFTAPCPAPWQEVYIAYSRSKSGVTPTKAPLGVDSPTHPSSYTSGLKL